MPLPPNPKIWVSFGYPKVQNFGWTPQNPKPNLATNLKCLSKLPIWLRCTLEAERCQPSQHHTFAGFGRKKNSHSFGALNLQPSTLQPPTPYLAGGGVFCPETSRSLPVSNPRGGGTASKQRPAQRAGKQTISAGVQRISWRGTCQVPFQTTWSTCFALTRGCPWPHC